MSAGQQVLPSLLISLITIGFGFAFMEHKQPSPPVLKGQCPYCDTAIEVPDQAAGGADCPVCKKRIVVRDQKFHQV